MYEAITQSALAKHGLIAFFGAIVHALIAHQNGRTKTVLDLLILTIISSFSGLLFSFVSLYFWQESYLTLAAAGAGGYLGVEGLQALTNSLKKSILANIR